MSDEMWTVFTVVLTVFAVTYWIALLVYIFWDDLVNLVEPGHTKNTKSVIIEEQPQNLTARFRNLRRPIK